MKERPIIFSMEMVKAILDGRKTITRRVVKDPRRPSRERDAFLSGSVGKPSIADLEAETELCKDIKPNFPCPYGQVGDRLWVRETWMLFGLATNCGAFIHYKASENENGGERLVQRPLDKPLYPSLKWRPSIFMPRWASRLTLEITEVRVEGINDISYEDSRLEGFLNPAMFHETWDSLNAKRGYGWNKNPWCWVIKFDNIGVRIK